jgi:hypothetical protein
LRRAQNEAKLPQSSRDLLSRLKIIPSLWQKQFIGISDYEKKEKRYKAR